MSEAREAGGSSYKAELRRRKEELLRPAATKKAQYVALVEKNWLRTLVTWINSAETPSPGPIPNHLLCKDGKLDASKRYGSDFGVVSDKIYDSLSSTFRGGPKIIRPYVLTPGTDKPCFILDPITLTIKFQEESLRKVVHGKWTVSMIKAQLCHAKKINKSRCSFKDMETKALIDDDAEIDSVASHQWFLEISSKHHRLEKRFHSLQELDARVIVATNMKIPYICSVIYVLSRIPAFTSVLAACKGPYTNILKDIIAELDSPGKEPVSVDPLLHAIAHEDDWEVIEGRADACSTLEFLLSLIIREVEGENNTPISDLVGSNIETCFECQHCHQTEISISRRILATLPLEISRDTPTALEEALSLFSDPVKLPDFRIKCKKCKRNTRPVKTMRVSEVSDLLILSYTRWDRSASYASFVDNLVEYPDTIDVSTFSKSQGVYKLIGVIFARRGSDVPHYMCSCYDEATDRWIFLDEDQAFVIDPTGAHYPDGYVLFYKKI